MANTITRQRLRSRLRVEAVNYTAASGSAALAGPIMDMKSYKGVMFGVVAPAAITGGCTLFEIVASTASNMASPALVTGRTSGTIDLDGAGDEAYLEVDHSDLATLSGEADKEEGASYRYVQPRLTCSNADGPFIIFAIGEPWEEKTDLTPSTTIA
jgi:hypothetical protein